MPEAMQTFVVQRLKTEIAALREDRAQAVAMVKWPEAVTAADAKIEAVELAIEVLYLTRVPVPVVEALGEEAPATVLGQAPSIVDIPISKPALNFIHVTPVRSAPTMPSPSSGSARSSTSEPGRAGDGALFVATPHVVEGNIVRPFKNGDVVRHKPSCFQGVITGVAGDFAYVRGKGPYRLTDLERVT